MDLLPSFGGRSPSVKHVVLLGDSIFDNAAYVRGGPDVVKQLRARLPQGWRASLAAVDGATTAGVSAQLRRLPKDATHLVVSVGGNDALSRARVISEPARSAADVFDRLASIGEQFRQSYHEMLESVLSRNLPTAICTIYFPRFPDATLQRMAAAGLSVFNDSITLEAFGQGIPLIDLRLICDDGSDYANPIEPSERGGAKIARAIAEMLTGHNFETRRTEIFI